MKRTEFSRKTMKAALVRQAYQCALCGTPIVALGKKPELHSFGEWGEAHHIRHARAGGDASLENCVIICWSCHYSAHGGGNYKDNSEQMQGTKNDFPGYRGTT
jgi:5-methylcytosine-specific restriction endonuclease McrA